MNFLEAYQAIKTRVDAVWPTLHAGVPLVYTNEQRPTFTTAPNCLHVEVRPGAAKTAAWGGGVGKNRQRQSGEVIFRLFVPADTGMETVLGMIEDACGILRYWGGAPVGLRFFDAAPAGGGEDDKDGVFYEQDAIASFFYDTIG